MRSEEMNEAGGRNLVSFGAVMLIIAGAFNAIDGVVALVNPSYFDDHHLLFSSLTAWGWLFAIYGGVQILIGVAVLRGSQIALWLGIVAAGANAAAQLAYVAHYPVWSVAIMVVDGVVIYAFMVRGMAVGIETVEPEASPTVKVEDGAGAASRPVATRS
jgi:hypothetical protein